MSKVKICGLLRIEDIVAANECMPDYIGFVFAKSRRQIDKDTARNLKSQLDKHISAVGVFVNQELEYIADLFKQGIIDLVQLHGDEDENYILKLKNICGCKIIKAIGISDSIPKIPANADYILFDKVTQGETRGGTGLSFNWEIIKGFNKLPVFLAGGLTVSNAGQAIMEVNPYCVDVSSGVETDGFKDKEKMNSFVRKVRNINN